MAAYKAKLKKIAKNQLKKVMTKKKVPFEHFESEWNDGSKPIAFAFGINTWKRKIIKEYFPEYQIGFIFGKATHENVKYFASKYKVKDFIIWGHKEDEFFTNYAEAKNIKVIRVEDGFIRSIGLGSYHEVPLSLAVDYSGGLYLNSQKSSDLEKMCNDNDFTNEKDLLEESRSLINKIVKHKISKYNDVVNKNPEQIYGEKTKKRVLVIGQVEDDASILYGMSRSMTHNELVKLAFNENPGAEIIYKPHPDVLHNKRNNTTDYDEIKSIARVIEEPLNLIDSFEEVDHVYTFTSLAGFEALIRGIKVTCLGMPFYAGWGLTDDREICERRIRKLTIEELFALAYIKYPRYLSSKMHKLTDIKTVINDIIEGKNALLYKESLIKSRQNKLPEAIYYAEKLLELDQGNIEVKIHLGELYEKMSLKDEAEKVYNEVLLDSNLNEKTRRILEGKIEKDSSIISQYSQYSRQNKKSSFPFFTSGDWSDDTKPIAVLIGVSFWKRQNLHLFFPEYRVAFAGTKVSGKKFSKLIERYRIELVAVWGYKEHPSVLDFCNKTNTKFMRMEDGFVQSVGVGKLGSAPASMILDSRTLYFDSTKPSDLEVLLENYDFDNNSEIIERAKKGIEVIKNLGITKYNSKDSRSVEEIYGPKTKRRVLVIGQVENDASIQYGANRRITNNDLVWTAYKENPDAEIIYKPHPEVILGTRAMFSDPNDVESIATVVKEPLSLAESFKTIDHVYTITSLSGFEALIRGIPVTCLGLPFYAGWGLTEDRQINVLRRQRRLTVEQLFAGAYLLYPRYLDENTGELTSFEQVVENLYAKLNEEPLVQNTKVLDRTANLMTRFNDQLAKNKTDEERAEIFYEMAKIKLENGQYDSELNYFLKKSYEAVDNWNGYELRIDYLYKTQGITNELMSLIDYYINNKLEHSAEKLIKFAAIYNDAGQYLRAITLFKEATNIDETVHNRARNLALNALLYQREPEIIGVSESDFSIYKNFLEQSEKFKELILAANGDFCVVGNEPSLEDVDSRQLIDSHELVIRFNDFKTEYPYSKDYGTKTDIWVREPYYNSVRRREENVKAVVFSGENLFYGNMDGQDIYSEFLTNNINLQIIPPEVYYELYEKLQAPPSIEIAFIYWVYKVTGPIKKENVFGLSLALEVDTIGKTTDRLNFNKERQLFHELCSKEQINDPIIHVNN